MDGRAAPWRIVELDAPSADGPRSAEPASAAADRGRLLPVAGIVAAAVLAIAAFLIAANGSDPTVEVRGDQPLASDGAAAGDATPAPRGSAGLVVVDVQGAVVHPGIVRLVAGSRVGDAIAAAGGYSPRVASDRLAEALNLAALVHDGDKVVVPSRDDRPGSGAGGATGGSGTSGGGGASGGTGGATGGGAGGAGPATPVDLNRATAEELDALPGIGPVTAAKIIAAREEQPFASVDDLRNRKILGAATFEKLKTLVTVR
ncbi:MAG TPA: ComEA family DNA-binding protein [Candidatus Limnocylindrales bacterium]|nr:ComEA family DNA-binding protein [Candidatus Limnocylindrales bacterium]